MLKIMTTKQTIGFIALCLALFGCQKPQPKVIVKYITIYRDTSSFDFINKIAQIETGANDSLSGENGAGRGRFGIYDICVKGSGLKDLLNFNHYDMHAREKSEAVFWAMMGIFCHLHYAKHGHYPTYQELARKWAGGPNGENKTATLKYLNKFRSL
jgi:hypothetical protein